MTGRSPTLAATERSTIYSFGILNRRLKKQAAGHESMQGTQILHANTERVSVAVKGHITIHMFQVQISLVPLAIMTDNPVAFIRS
jgi:hypothetical protein